VGDGGKPYNAILAKIEPPNAGKTFRPLKPPCEPASFMTNNLHDQEE
jgi:hypothetical protein